MVLCVCFLFFHLHLLSFLLRTRSLCIKKENFTLLCLFRTPFYIQCSHTSKMHIHAKGEKPRGENRLETIFSLIFHTTTSLNSFHIFVVAIISPVLRFNDSTKTIFMTMMIMLFNKYFPLPAFSHKYKFSIHKSTLFDHPDDLITLDVFTIGFSLFT